MVNRIAVQTAIFVSTRVVLRTPTGQRSAKIACLAAGSPKVPGKYCREVGLLEKFSKRHMKNTYTYRWNADGYRINDDVPTGTEECNREGDEN